MKDPLDNKARAYEVLGVHRNASREGITAAYNALCRREPARRRQLTLAWHRLRKPETRIEEDFWYYDVADQDRVEQASSVGDEAFEWDPVLPPIEIGLEFTDLAQGRYRRDFSALEYRKVEMSHLGRFDEDPAAAIPINFDR
jgi:hypothetical protein